MEASSAELAKEAREEKRGVRTVISKKALARKKRRARAQAARRKR
jgi:hypothetical protein